MPQNATDLRRTIAECGKVAKRVGVVVTSVAEAEAAAASGCSFLLVKGNEAGGLVGEETSFVLLQRLAAKTDLPLYAWGGIGLHTTAACLQAGAQGIVLDWQMALLDDIAAPLWIRRRLAAADGGETLAVPIGGGRALRFHAQGPGEAKKLMLRLAERIAEEDLPDEQWQRELAELTSADANERLLLAGQDWAFAANFRRHADSVAGALELLRRKSRQQLLAAVSARALQRGAAIAQSHGTEFPLVQGPMTRVSDCPEFCAAVAEAGALPFLALALMPGPQVEDLLRRTRVRLGSRPWGVGILGFAGRELREAQFQAIEKLRPPFALIAGGRPDQAAALEALEIQAYLHVPSPVMLKAFLKDGCRRFVFEGRECGGHVGPRSSFVLWESMIEVLLQAGLSADEAREVHVLFAGGIHDGLSAAMVAALAQPLVEQGMKIGGLMGTAYLFTEEVVASGAIVPQFQQVALDAAGTSVVECGPGHAIRCAETPFVDHFERERRRLRAEVRHGDESREVLESLCLGRLRIASKGIARQPQVVASESPYVEVNERRQHDEGMYMLGQVAALRDKRLRIRQLHEEVCGTGPAANRGLGTVGLASAKPVVQPFEIAIVGMGCLLPGAPNMAAFWENILARRDCLREVPSDRFEAERWYDPDRAQRDKIYSKWGGFLEDVVFNPLKYGIPPKSLASIEPAQLLTLELVDQALRDAGLDKQNPYRERTSVILGAGGGLGELGTNYAVRSMLPRFVENPDESLWQELPEWTEDSFAGFLLNVLAGRVASRFDLGGVNYTVDAACASSLAAVYLSCRELTDGSSDVVIAGGVDTMQHPFSFTAFAKTEALSPRGKCRPFDANADGIAISEGLAAVVLKRLTDAQRDGDRIYAVLRGVAGGSDGRHTSITAPSRGGQRRTLERAYIQAQVRPSDCDLFEAHGTGTAVGDVIECETLGAVLRADGASRGSKSLGSVKSMIGHTKSAAGVAGLIKAALAVYHGVLPATLHVEKPNPKCGFDDSPLHPNTQTRPWTKTEGLRTAGVSAFGFGGTNFHAVVQEYQRASEQNPWRTASKRRPVELFAFQAATKESLAGSVQTLLEPLRRAMQAGASIDLADWAATWHKQSGMRSGSARAAIVAVSAQHLLESLTALVNRLRAQAETGLPAGVYYTESPLAAQGKVAVVFPGQGSQFPHMVRELAIEFPAVRQVFERAEQCVALTLERPLCRYIFPTTAFTDDERASQVEALKATEVAQPALAAANAAMWKLLQHLGLHADMVAGHSFGELVALYAAGSIHEGTLFQLARERGQAMVHARLRQPDLGHMLAVSGDSPAVELALAGLSDVWISNHNSPRQTTISGTASGLQRAKERLAAAGLSTAEMAVSCAFHSPLMLLAREHFAGTLEQTTIAAPRMVVYANGTGEVHPPDAAEIRRRLADHLVQGVLFAEQVRHAPRWGSHFRRSGTRQYSFQTHWTDIARSAPSLCSPAAPRRAWHQRICGGDCRPVCTRM